MKAWVMCGAASLLLLAATKVHASETISVNPGKAGPEQNMRRPARVENLSGKMVCEVMLAPNGVVQYTEACTAWPLVAKSKQWRRSGARLEFLDANGQSTITFYETGKDVFVTGRAQPEFLRLTILVAPPQSRLQPSIPLK
jgi:hypothetical protein